MDHAPPSNPSPSATGPDVAILDTTELRWFAAGPLPADVESWFTRSGRHGTVEDRCDTYRIDGRQDTGVKHRFRETPELKVRQAVEGTLALEPGLAGALEAWRRWSPAYDLTDHGEHALVEDVCKRVIKRRFSVFGDEVFTGPPLDSGCEVEVAAVIAGPVEAWTFAFAAYGPVETRRSSLLACWRALVTDAPPPEIFGRTFGRSCGYPEWLGLVLASGAIESDRLGREPATI